MHAGNAHEQNEAAHPYGTKWGLNRRPVATSIGALLKPHPGTPAACVPGGPRWTRGLGGRTVQSADLSELLPGRAKTAIPACALYTYIYIVQAHVDVYVYVYVYV